MASPPARKFLKGSQKLRAVPRRPRLPSVILRAPAAAKRQPRGAKNAMSIAATAPASAVVFLFVLSFLCFMSGAALRRWPDKVQAYFERVDGSLWFVSPGVHRALIQATGIALTSLSLLAVVGARLIS